MQANRDGQIEALITEGHTPSAAEAQLPTFALWHELLIGVGVTTLAWLLVAMWSRPTEETKLRSFYRRTRPGGPGWRAVLLRAKAEGESLEAEGRDWEVPRGILCMLIATLTVYATLFATGWFFYGRLGPAILLAVIAIVGGISTIRLWNPSKG